MDESVSFSKKWRYELLLLINTWLYLDITYMGLPINATTSRSEMQFFNL